MPYLLRKLALRGAALVLIALPLAVHAQNVDTTAAWDGVSAATTFGVPYPAAVDTIGQTFTAPATATVLTGVNLELGYNYGNTLTFTAYLMAWDGTEATGSPLFTSDPITISSATSGIGLVQFPMNITVTPGSKYVFFLYASPGTGAVATANLGITGSNTSYSGGNVVFTESFGTFSNVTTAWTQNDGDSVFGDAAFAAFFPAAASQTITIGTIPTPTYGGSPFSLSATSTSGLPVTITLTGGPVTGSGNGPYTIKAAGSATFQATQPGNADYTAATPVNFSVTIAPATLLVTPTSVSRPFDTPNPTFTYTVGPFVNGDTSAVISGTPTLTTTAIGTSPAGTYPITADVSAMSATNYIFSPVAGTLTITGGDAQTIVFPQPPTLALGQSYHLAAFTTSGLPVTYTVSGAGSLNGNYVVAGGSPGTITVTASQPGNASYAAATSVVRSFNVQ
jgi:hypothetical protein